MGIKYIWDTNTVIYYLQQQFPPLAERYMDKRINEARPVISAITEIELLCWKSATEKDLEVLYNFIDDALVIELEQPIKYKTADIRKKHKIKLPDAIIAATALVHELTIITRNTKDFEKIEELEIINPYEV
ncbi:MAG: type II toxin-antitoxin system VapC family toxin [Bacteroidales bacterium]|nr:type II toxin-antitoxin system VapC family toxin [Bacteroidales bacterium]